MNAQNLRVKTKKDVIPTKVEGQSFMQWIEANNGGHLLVYGAIGYTGTKNHSFLAYYININGENVIVNLSSHCGSQSYGSGLATNLQMTKDQVTCQKCLKH